MLSEWRSVTNRQEISRCLESGHPGEVKEFNVYDTFLETSCTKLDI